MKNPQFYFPDTLGNVDLAKCCECGMSQNYIKVDQSWRMYKNCLLVHFAGVKLTILYTLLKICCINEVFLTIFSCHIV